MPVPTHFKFTVRGIFRSTPETWSTSCHFGRKVDLGPDAALSDIDDGAVTSAVAAYFGSAYFSNAIEVQDWRFYDIGTDGRMEGNAPLMHTFAPGALRGGNSGTNLFPTQISLVATLVATDKGPAKFGRMYLPVPYQALQTDFRYSDAQAETYRAELETFLVAVNHAIDLPGTPSPARAVNVSRGPAGSSTGTIQHVDHLEMGRVLDTVRNRRKSLLEERHVGAEISW